METHQVSAEIPPEILSHIFVELQPLDLFSAELVRKSWRETLDANIWKEVGVKEFGLSPNHQNLANQAKKMAKINNNIRQCRCVMTVLAPAKDHKDENHLIGYISFNETTAAVNWLRRRGQNSGQIDYSAETAIIDIKTREVKIVHAENAHCLVLHGPYLTQMVILLLIASDLFEAWNGYNIVLDYHDTKHAEISGTTVQASEATIGAIHNGICINEDVDMQHLVAIVELDLSDQNNVLRDLKIQIYNMAEKQVVHQIKLTQFASRNYLYLTRPGVVFKGNKLYCHLQQLPNALVEFDITKPQVQTMHDMSNLPDNAILTGVNMPFAFGVAQNKIAWCYNFATKTVAQYSCSQPLYVLDVKWYCGLLMISESYSLVFVDPRAKGEVLPVVARFAADAEFGRPRICDNGKVFGSGIYCSVKMLDFEHVNNEIQLLVVTGREKSDMKPHNIKAYQLTEAVTEIFGSTSYISRYVTEKHGYRYGILFQEPPHAGGKLSITFKVPGQPEYTSPYFPWHMSPANSPAVTTSPGQKFLYDLVGVHRTIVLLCERFDGDTWRLAAPADSEQWSAVLEMILSGSKSCLVQ